MTVCEATKKCRQIKTKDFQDWNFCFILGPQLARKGIHLPPRTTHTHTLAFALSYTQGRTHSASSVPGGVAVAS